MKLSQLKTLCMSEPLGIDVNPYFSWIIESETPDTMQRSYRLTVTDEAGKLCWDTGTVESDQNSYLPYSGETLESRTVYHWSVSVEDNHGNVAAASSTFETAFLGGGNWAAQWARSPFQLEAGKAGFGNQAPATMFRQSFLLGDKPSRVRIYATCHGIYELYVNGNRPDLRSFAPEHTTYEKYLCYQTYDITALCQKGKNAVGLYVGDGWYLCPQALPNIEQLDHAHAVLFQIEVTYADGSREQICSGEQTKAAYGPVLFSDLYAGEKYDANRELYGWTTVSFDDSAFQSCQTKEYGYDNLRAQLGEPVISVAEFPVKELIHSPKGETILDFGQNMAGRVRMRVNAPKGTEITLEHCEVLDKQGNYFNNISSTAGVGNGCDQKDVYICDGKETVYEPHFTYHGFRYVKVSGIEVIPEDFTAVALSTNKADIGSFVTSDARLNRLYQNIRWSQRSNMLSIPTDCPQREKAGWTGDMLVYAKTAMLNEDCTAFFSRWLYNMSCEQDDYGIIPMVVPLVGAYPMMGKMINLSCGLSGLATSSGWGDAAVIVPYSMYQVTGNLEILRQQYDCMRRWCDYVITQAATQKPKDCTRPDEIERYIWDTGYHYGEWLIPSQSTAGLDMNNLGALMAMSSCYTAPIFGWHSVNIFTQIAGLLADSSEGDARYVADRDKYGDVAAHMKNAIQKGVIREDGSMPSDLMGAYVLPIYFDLVPEQLKKLFADNLIASLEKNGMRMDTGFLGSPYLLDALCKIGRQDVAYQLLWQDQAPSWLSEVDAGGTTIWENTFGYDENGNPGNLSFNHYAFGCVADWMFRNIGGIDTDGAGFKHLVIAPKPDGKLTSARRSFETSQGTAVCDWTIQPREDGEVFMLYVSVPCNTTATVRLPDGTTHEIGSGNYSFETSSF